MEDNEPPIEDHLMALLALVDGLKASAVQLVAALIDKNGTDLKTHQLADPNCPTCRTVAELRRKVASL